MAVNAGSAGQAKRRISGLPDNAWPPDPPRTMSGNVMSQIVYIVGAIVIVLFVLGFLGLR